MNYLEMTDDELLGCYQHLHGDSELCKELIKRGYTPKTKPYLYADGSRGYMPYVLKDGEKVLG